MSLVGYCKYLVLYIIVLVRSNNFSWFVYATCKLVLCLTYPPFKLNAFDTTGPVGSFNPQLQVIMVGTHKVIAISRLHNSNFSTLKFKGRSKHTAPVSPEWLLDVERRGS